MDFIDEAKIYVRAGDGGKGCISFRREKYVPRGGPDGGNGGDGGDVIFVANSQLSTLQDFKYQQHYTAETGKGGGGSQKTGRSGEDLIVQVPVGTVLKREEDRQILADLDQNKQTVTIAKGGRGGRGNLVFVTSTNQAPRQADDGEPGESLTLRLELKLLADVALVGFPNAGKSTLLSVISAAKPKIADYPFTTLTPNLGVVDLPDKSQHKGFVVADIPGLIEGAHTGKGLGIRFLKHLERSRVLWFVIDANSENPGPLQTYQTLLHELQAYQEGLEKRPGLVVLNKTDLNPDPARLQDLVDFCRKNQVSVHRLSAATRQGLQPLLWETENLLQKLRPAASEAENSARIS